MITFLDENDVEYGALATIKATNAVNGERSLTGTIVSGDYVLSKIERGWRLRFEDEYYVVTYAKPVDEGKNVQVSFDAVHQFFWDFGKSSVYDQLSDGSHTFRAYLDFIFNSSGYRYDIESSLTVKAFEKQSFGYKNRLSLFNDVITSSGVEFQVNGKVVRILAKVGTDLSTVVRKNFNLNELGIEKNIGDFVTYQKGFGAYFDEEDHSKGRLIAEYISPLASVYGRLEADPLVDERYKQSESLLNALKETVDNSYTISVSLDMEDLTQAGYRYTQPVAGDYIMAINETLGFKEKIRIVSFTSEYDVAGQLIKHTVTCNDIGSVKKLSASYTQTQHQAANAEVNANTAYEFANKALVSANGKNTNYYGDTFPVDNPKGTLKKGDLLFLTVGDTVKQYYWNGAEWVINPVLDDVEAFKEQIAEELKDVPNREEFENKIAEELATSKAEIETQIESAKTQAESNAKEYADTINQETAKVAELANAAAGEIKADLVNVKNNLTATSLVANNAQAAVDAAKQELAEVNSKVDSAKQELTQAKQELTNVADDLSEAKTDFQNAVSAVDTKATNLKSDLTQAKQDLNSQAQQLQAQANAQSELTKRVSSVEKTANGTKTTVSELSKTVAQNGKDITSVTNRTKTVEDDLAGTKTTLSQVKTTADSTSQKTATLETGLNGLSAKFDNLKIGGANLLLYSADPWQAPSGYYVMYNAAKTNETYNGSVVYKTWGAWSRLGINLGKHLVERRLLKVGDVLTYSVLAKTDQKTPIQSRLFVRYDNQSGTENINGKAEIINLTNEWQKVSVTFTVTEKMLSEENRVNYLGWEQTTNSESGKYVYYTCNKIERGNVPTDYSPNDADLEQKVAEYRQNADQNYASLQTTVQNLDGTVQHNKTVADQTAQGFSTRIESLETYKDGESERANAYFESAKTETAKQLTAERTAIAKDYVAKSTYTSDVTGIRNDLSATTTTANTTKTNLANYQASNDKMVASLKSSLQTTDGNVSNLQTKVEAVPGQITSAVSSVESKIPTEIGARNYIRNYGLTATGWISLKPAWKFEIISDSTAKSGQYLKATCTTASTGLGGFYKNLFDFSDGRFFGKQMTWAMDVKASKNTNLNIGCEWGDAQTNVNVTENWQRFYKTFEVATSSKGKAWIFYGKDWNVGDIVYIRDVQLEDGPIATSPVPAIEDTESDITKLSSELTQTKDGITLLATKTELSTAKNELQSGINTATNKANAAQSTANNNAQTISTHTTQISALNTGLQAKVSQSDFNTLSGRVTTAENNIIAKANELSSKITTVEGKIPTELGVKNLIIKSTAKTGVRLASDGGEFQDPAHALSDWIKIEPNTTYTLTTYEDVNEANMFYSLAWYSTNSADYSGKISRPTGAATAGTLKGGKQYTSPANAAYAKVSYPTKYSKVKLERGKVSTDYTPAPEDYDSKLATAQSEFKQTTDAIKASVSSLDKTTVKSSSLTINADGIVMKAGKSTADVANAIGSYFSVNQNAINLFSDKINVKGNMIVSGAITSDKIASKQINTSHLNGKIITADVISSNAVTAGAIKAGAVTTDKMSANSINGDRIAAGTLDAAKIKAGSITASQIASGTITSNQIKAGGISSANIAAGAITGDKIAAGAIDANKIAANAITANMIRGGQLNSTNGATVFDLNAGTLTFNNNYGYIQRVASDKIFEITTYLGTSSGSQEYLDSAFMVRKSDNSRQAGIKFTLYNTVENKPTAEAKMNADALILYDSQNTRLFSVHGKSTFAGGVNFQGWGDIPIAKVHGGLVVNDIGIGGHTKSLLKIVEELCKKAGILWV